ncbi:ATP-binding cassette domain-containing protein [Austwickia chelonae]|uniref:ATP-binding cassette domain-containing protein n=1 Tax=Austwickia chelonae TaxID=100225 RepID=UPI0013C379C3|nr:ATP-binding cassette domain-containing protein [Austwickia chelonae]
MIDQRLWLAVRPHRGRLTLTTALLCLITVSWWVQAVALSVSLAAVVAGDHDRVVAGAVGVVICLTVRALLREWQVRSALRLGEAVRTDLRRGVLRACLVPERLHDAQDRMGARMLAATDGVDGVDKYVSLYIPHVVQVWVMPPLLIMVVGSAYPAVGVVAAVGVLIAVAGPRWWDRLMTRRGGEHSDTYEGLSADLLESLRSMRLLRAVGAVERRRRLLEERSQALHRATVRAMRVSLASTAVIDGGVQVGVVASGLCAAVVAAGGSLPGGAGFWSQVTPFMVLMLASEIFRPVRDLARQWHSGYVGLSFMSQVDKALPEGVAGVLARTGESEDLARRAQAEDIRAVRIEGVSFSWPDGTPVLSGVSAHWPLQGQVVGVAGPSGVGKSTLLDIVSGLLSPTGGRVVVECSDGERAPRPEDVAVVSQHPVFLAGTIRENLLVAARPGTSDETLLQALAAAAAPELAERGLDHVLAEGGRSLSGGQRQRLAIARALVSDRPVMVLDEPTSALDAERSATVMQTLVRESARRVVVVTAHQADALAACDEVLDLEGVRR